MINSLTRLARVDPGWNASGLLMFYLVMYLPARRATQVDPVVALRCD